MKIIKKILDEHTLLIVWVIFLIGNNPITINKGNDWFFAIIFLLSWISCAVLLLKYLLTENEEKITSVLIVFLLNVLSLFVFFLMAFVLVELEGYYADYQRIIHISGRLYLSDMLLLLLIAAVIVLSHYCTCLIISRWFKNLKYAALKKVFFTASTISMFFMVCLRLAWGFAPEFAGKLF